MVIGAICDTDPAKAELAAAEYPDVPFYDDYIAMLDSGDVDAVVTCVPHYLHPEMGIDALSSATSTPSWRSRPASTPSRSGSSTRSPRRKPELTFAIMFNQRNNPLYQRLKEIVDDGEIGSIRRTNWIITNWWRPQGYYDQSEWRATWGGEGGGVLVNQAPHQLDLWQWICGVPKSVYAKVAYGFRRDIAVEDEVTALVDYGNGATGRLRHRRRTTSSGTDRFEILGDQGKIVVENSKTATVTRLKKPERELSDGMDMDDVMKLFMGELNPGRATTPPRSSSSSPPGARSTPASWRTSPPTSSTARRCSPRDRTASRVSGWPTRSISRAGPARRWRWTSTRTSSSPS